MGLFRFIFATSVVSVHAGSIFGLHFIGGRIAVQAFYVISGFYMSLILNEKYINKNNSYKLFLSNRFLRIFPIYWIVLLLTFLFIAFSHGISDNNTYRTYMEYFQVFKPLSFIFLIFTNLFIFFQDIVMFMGININNGSLFFTSHAYNLYPQLSLFLLIPQAWTIGVELMFYLLAPLIVRRSLKFIVPLILLSFFLRIYLMSIGFNKDPWTYRLFPTELIFFLFGNISYKIYTKIRGLNIKNICYRSIFVFLLMFIVSFEFISSKLWGYVFIIIFALLMPFIFCYTKNNKIDAYIGDLSYPIYISHVFIIGALGLYNASKLGIYYGFIVLCFTILFSILLNKTISKRIEKIRQKRVYYNGANI